MLEYPLQNVKLIRVNRKLAPLSKSLLYLDFDNDSQSAVLRFTYSASGLLTTGNSASVITVIYSPINNITIEPSNVAIGGTDVIAVARLSVNDTTVEPSNIALSSTDLVVTLRSSVNDVTVEPSNIALSSTDVAVTLTPGS